MKTLYYVAINTNAKMDADTYDEAAKALVKAFEALFLDADKVASVTMDHKKAPAEIESCHSEVEVSYSAAQGAVGACVVELVGPQKVMLDKAKMSALLRDTVQQEGRMWHEMKIEKRGINDW